MPTRWSPRGMRAWRTPRHPPATRRSTPLARNGRTIAGGWTVARISLRRSQPLRPPSLLAEIAGIRACRDSGRTCGQPWSAEAESAARSRVRGRCWLRSWERDGLRVQERELKAPGLRFSVGVHKGNTGPPQESFKKLSLKECLGAARNDSVSNCSTENTDDDGQVRIPRCKQAGCR